MRGRETQASGVEREERKVHRGVGWRGTRIHAIERMNILKGWAWGTGRTD